LSTPTIVTTSLAVPEGPVPLADGAWLVTELDTKVGTVTRVLGDGTCVSHRL
jgi:hypothetical protein